MPMFMKITDIKGEVTESAHRGWIELSSAQFGVGRNISSPSGGSASREGPSKVSEIVVTKPQDCSSVHLFSEALTGKGGTVFIDFVKDGAVYLRLTMSNTLIASYNISGSGRDAMESLSLNFTSVEFKSNPGTPPP